MIHKLTTATSGDAAITFICPEDCQLIGVGWRFEGTAAVDGASMRAELSFLPTNQLTTNETVNVIDELRAGFEITTSGGGIVSVYENTNLMGMGNPVKVEAGEKLYLNWALASVTGRVTLFLYTSARTGHGKRNLRRS